MPPRRLNSPRPWTNGSRRYPRVVSRRTRSSTAYVCPGLRVKPQRCSASRASVGRVIAAQEVKPTTGPPAPSASIASSRRRTVSSSGARRSKGSVSTAGNTTVRTSSRNHAPASWNEPSGSGTSASTGRRARIASQTAKTGSALEGSPCASRVPIGAFHHPSSRSRAGRLSSNSSRVCVIDFEPCRKAPSAPSRGVRRSAYHRFCRLKPIESEDLIGGAS